MHASQDTIIVTGGNGFVGKHLIAELQREHTQARLIVWDRNTNGVALAVEAERIDITDPASYEHVLKAAQPTWVVHLAAVSAVGVALENPALAHRVNVDATASLLRTISSVSKHTRVLVVSSADIYGAQSPEPIAELPLSACKPPNPYAQSKLDMELMIEETYSGMCIRVRPFPHIGPGQQEGFVTADFAMQIAAIEAGKQEPVLRVGNLQAKRDFTDVRDVVRAYRLLLTQGEMGEVYNEASGKAVGIDEILNALRGMSSVTIQIEQDASRMRPSDTPIITGDASKLTQATGWTPSISLKTSLSDILTYWRGKNS